MSRAAAKAEIPFVAQIASPLKWARQLLWRDLSLSARLMAAMVALVLVTAISVGVLTYRAVSVTVVPQELERLHARARWLAAELDRHVLEA